MSEIHAATSKLPEIVDVEWKLDIVANTSNVVSDKIQYTVILKTSTGEDIVFICNIQQLQDIVYKLKNLIRHCENIKTSL